MTEESKDRGCCGDCCGAGKAGSIPPASGVVRACKDCGAEMPYPGRGRPALRCADCRKGAAKRRRAPGGPQ